MSASPRRRSEKFLLKSSDAEPNLHRAMDVNRIRTKWQWTASLAAVVVLLLTAGAYGQSASFGVFTGRAQEPEGASVAGATVTATNQETGIVRTTQTTSDDLYRFDDLPPGIYEVVIEARSFARVEVKNV